MCIACNYGQLYFVLPALQHSQQFIVCSTGSLTLGTAVLRTLQEYLKGDELWHNAAKDYCCVKLPTLNTLNIIIKFNFQVPYTLHIITPYCMHNYISPMLKKQEIVIFLTAFVAFFSLICSSSFPLFSCFFCSSILFTGFSWI